MSTVPEPKPPEPVPAPAVAPPSAVPGAGQTASEPPLVPPPFSHPPTAAAPKLFLAVTGLALVAWLAWLSVTALNKTRDPIVSRAQAAIAPIPVVAKVRAGGDGKPDATVVVVKPLTDGGLKELKAGGELVVVNLSSAQGFGGEGEYLLLLTEPFVVNGKLTSQLVLYRTTASDADPPVIYKWSADVEKQAERLYRGK